MFQSKYKENMSTNSDEFARFNVMYNTVIKNLQVVGLLPVMENDILE